MTTDQMSVLSYHSMNKWKKDGQRQAILSLIRGNHQPSNADLTEWSKLPRASVCGRLKELENKGYIYKAGKKVDPNTGKMVNYYAVIE